MSTTIELFGTGVVMGVIHTLTGPDHLSALATLSGTNISSQTFLASFLLGIKWGLGHSLGLLVVGGILIAMEEGSNDWIGMDTEMKEIIDTFVGVFMLALGCYGLHKACRNKQEAAASTAIMSRSLSKESLAEAESILKNSEMNHRRKSMEIIEQMAEALNRDGDDMRGSGGGLNYEDNEERDIIVDMDADIEQRIFHAAQSLRQNSDISSNDSNDKQFMMGSLKASAKGALSRSFVSILTADRPASLMKASSFVHDHNASVRRKSITLDNHSNEISRCSCFSMSTSGVLAIIAGIVHGVAGTGGVLGVIPAVQLRNAKLASIYLSAFCLTSTLVMGGFAALYGRFSIWLAGGRGEGSYGGSRVFQVEAGSAFLSIAVGIVWLVLLSIGGLEEIFP